jgi:Lhr-like helicase
VDPVKVFDELRTYFMRYYDTPYSLAAKDVQEERRRLLDRDLGAYREPLLELVRDYKRTANDLAGSCRKANADPDLEPFSRAGLLPQSIEHLYLHQEQALEAGLSGRNFVITAGTGSGKTEGMYLPVLSSLLAESRTWDGSPGTPSPDWWRSSGDFVPQRLGDSGRLPAMRALVMYPMNALVEDQLYRLRRALDSEAARKWLDANRLGHRFYFGRYTGPTPVPGDRTGSARLRELRLFLREAERRAAKAEADDRASGKTVKRYFLPRLDGAEMRSRWDMQLAPPDILITNYSMLNVMLLRQREDAFFTLTEEWLSQDRSRRFTLVVDELHSYRGTAGSEVAYLLRNLLLRLGLDRRPEQLRVIASSASFDGKRDLAFLEGFFGVPASSFEVIEGERVRKTSALTDPPTESASARQILAVANIGDLRAEAASAYVESAYGDDEILSLPALTKRLFADVDDISGTRAGTSQLLEKALHAGPDEAIRIRAHYFFRNIEGIWACSNPDCDQVPAPKGPDRTVGKLYAQPQYRCDCGGRVLVLHYCQTCGDLFLGGFASPDDVAAPGLAWYLLPDFSQLEALPDKSPSAVDSSNYLLYWPRLDPPRTEHWTRAGFEFSFRRSGFDPIRGRVINSHRGQTGWTFHIVPPKKQATTKTMVSAHVLPPFPTICPRCGADWERGRTKLAIDDPDRLRSPIRGMHTGLEKTSQVLLDALMRQLKEPRKLVLFSDSRQDAAKLSAGVEKSHYQDMVRQILVTGLDTSPAKDLALYEGFERREDRSDEARAAARRFREQYPDEAEILSDEVHGDASALGAASAARERIESLALPITGLVRVVHDGLLARGVNPGGPDFSLQGYGQKPRRPWTDLFDWNVAPPRARSGRTLPPDSLGLQSAINENLWQECVSSLYKGGGMDFESLGLALPTVPVTVPGRRLGSLLVDDVVASSIRILGELRRFQGGPVWSADPPARLRAYWKALSSFGSEDEIRDAVESSWTGVVSYQIDQRQLVLRMPSGDAWTCPRCRRQHLQPSGGVCTFCGERLIGPRPTTRDDTDYYAFLARSGGAPFRLHCEELTGQTDRIDALRRQTRFQGIFLDDEPELADEVDLLSVTTTMEAGIDIGDLKAVAMSNMPPMRFNYQQRTGRAGRRDDPLSIALTLCRARSHDEYYFVRPDRITTDPPPPPYLDLKRAEIVKRVLTAEVLRLGFRSLGEAVDIEDLGDNVHGSFGTCGGWPQHRQAIAEWISQHGEAIDHLLTALLAHTDRELAAESGSLRDFVDKYLLGSIDEASQGANPLADLSERLADRGFLPMFGFPTRVRYLYHDEPKQAFPWPPKDVIDRELSIASSQFAPGGEVVKDKAIHVAVGLANWIPRGGRLFEDPSPLGDCVTVDMCRSCTYIKSVDAEPIGATCPVCSATAPLFERLTVSQPTGFRSDFRPKDFEGRFDWRSRSLTPRVVPETGDITASALLAGNLAVTASRGSVYTVNDNNGKRFRFVKGPRNWPGYLSLDLAEERAAGTLAIAPYLPQLTGPADAEVALGAVEFTDTMILGIPTTPHGLSLFALGRTPVAVARRGAWYSLGFLLREAASRYLDVGEQELEVGLAFTKASGAPEARLFLADTLANGAGYATHLAQAAVFRRVLDEAASFVQDLRLGEHSLCDSSCYDCLRDYANMAFHPLLDWRLGADMLAILEGNTPDLTRWADIERRRANEFARSFGGQVRVFGDGVQAVEFSRSVVLVTHPLEEDLSPLGRRLTGAQAEASSAVAGGKIVLADTFNLLRRPGAVAANLGSWM